MSSPDTVIKIESEIHDRVIGARKDERDKVLNEIISRIQAKQPLPEPYDDWNQGVLDGCGMAIDIIDELKEELHQSKGGK